MDFIPQDQLDSLAHSFNLPTLNLSPDKALSLTLNNKYDVSIEYNKSFEILVILKMPLMQYEIKKLIFLLQNISFLENPKLDLSVAYGKEHILMIVNLGTATQCSAKMIEKSLSDLINFYEELSTNYDKK